jgi:hypothetical protein
MSNYFDNKDSFLQPKVTQYGSHMVMTNVTKPTQTKFWNIDTRFHDDYDSYLQTTTGRNIPHYTFTLPQTINEVKSITVDNVELPISFYTISNNFGNNVMQINSTLIKIPDGTYTAATLKTAFASVISAASITGVSYDISNNGNPYSSFKNTSGSAITISFAVKSSNTCSGITNSGSQTATADFDKFNIKSKLGWLLGFRNINYTIANNITLYSESIIDLNQPRYLYLVVDEFINGNPNSFISPLPTSIINKNILAKIVMDYQHYGFGSVLTANQYNGLLLSEIRKYSGKVNLQKLKIQMVNEYGATVNMNGMDFSFCLEIDYE